MKKIFNKYFVGFIVEKRDLDTGNVVSYKNCNCTYTTNGSWNSVRASKELQKDWDLKSDLYANEVIIRSVNKLI